METHITVIKKTAGGGRDTTDKEIKTRGSLGYPSVRRLLGPGSHIIGRDAAKWGGQGKGVKDTDKEGPYECVCKRDQIGPPAIETKKEDSTGGRFGAQKKISNRSERGVLHRSLNNHGTCRRRKQ